MAVFARPPKSGRKTGFHCIMGKTNKKNLKNKWRVDISILVLFVGWEGGSETFQFAYEELHFSNTRETHATNRTRYLITSFSMGDCLEKQSSVLLTRHHTF